MINILIADDHQIVREGLAEVLSKNISMKVVGQAINGKQAVELCERLKPDIVVMDIGMPILNGIDAVKLIKQKSKLTKIIILSMYCDENTVLRVVNSGVSGFVLKTGASSELISAIYSVANGKTYLPPEIGLAVIGKIHNNDLPLQNKNLNNLTNTERQVLQLVAEGHSSKAIAKLLGVSFHTVKTHRNHIMEKLDLHNVARLTKYALENKLTIKE